MEIFIILGFIVLIAIIPIVVKREITERNKVYANEGVNSKDNSLKQKEYTLFKSPTGAIEAVKKGWSWPGFFFPWIWAFVKGLYPVAIIALIVELPSVFIHPIAGSLAFIIIAFVLGSKGNEMRRDNLLKRGFQFVCTISADTPDGALALFAQGKNTQVAQMPDYTQKPQTTEAFSNLIDCPDCKKLISRKAASCPGCGCPVALAQTV